MGVQMKSCIIKLSAPISFLAFLYNFKLPFTVIKFTKKTQSGSSLFSWKSWPRMLYQIQGVLQMKKAQQRRNIDSVLSTCQFSIGNVRSWWCSCEVRGWDHKLKTARKYVRLSPLKKALRQKTKMWTNLWRVKAQGCVHRETTPLDPLLYDK